MDLSLSPAIACAYECDRAAPRSSRGERGGDAERCGETAVREGVEDHDLRQRQQVLRPNLVPFARECGDDELRGHDQPTVGQPTVALRTQIVPLSTP